MDEPPSPPFDLEKALAALAGRRSLLIYTHDNPDPDALAAALGLQRLAEHELNLHRRRSPTAASWDAPRTGRWSRTSRCRSRPSSASTSRQFDTIAMVDSQPETGNNSLPHGHRIDIVIDHHPLRPDSARAAWCDIRPDLGATSTIVFEYLRQRAVPIDAPLATAFFFALRTETRDLGRESTDAERRAYLALVPLVDHNLLYRMTHPKVPRAHFAALDRALRSALLFGDLVAVNLGALGYPDLVAEIADLLLSYEGARFVLCMGQYEDNPYMSLRTEADNARAGTVMRQVVGNDGAAGGHGTMAGARLFARVSSEAELAVTFQDMVQRLLAALGHSVTPGDPLLSLPPPTGGKTWSGRARLAARLTRHGRGRDRWNAPRAVGGQASPARSRARPPSTPESPRTRRTPEAPGGGRSEQPSARRDDAGCARGAAAPLRVPGATPAPEWKRLGGCRRRARLGSWLASQLPQLTEFAKRCTRGKRSPWPSQDPRKHRRNCSGFSSRTEIPYAL